MTDRLSVNSYEPLFDSKYSKHTLYPINFPEIFGKYKEQLNAFWSPDEIDFSTDYADWETLKDNEKKVLEFILAFFSNSDSIVNLNISERLLDEIQPPEAKYAYNFQMAMENIHSEVYSMLIETYIKDESRKKYLFDSIKTIPTIKAIADWGFKWIDNNNISFAERIIAFACIEGILFSGAFAVIFWFKHHKNNGRAFLPGLMKSNELISRDEGMHTDFACTLYKYINNKLSNDTVNNIVKEAIEISMNFNASLLETKLIGLNVDLLNEYSKYVGDRLLVSLGYSKLYNNKNPFSFMETIGMVQKTNFHESRPSEYRKSVKNNKNPKIVLEDSTSVVYDEEDF